MGKNELLELCAYKERKRKHTRPLRHQMALIKLHVDGLSVSDPNPCGLHFPRSTHGSKKSEGKRSWQCEFGAFPDTKCFAVLGAWWHRNIWFSVMVTHRMVG